MKTSDRTMRGRTLALGDPGSAFYASFRYILNRFGEVEFRHEREFGESDDLLRLVKAGRFDRVLMPNPYGNPQRLGLYRALREEGVPVVASDRGALPDSWFFDAGFNYDSPSYQPEAWDHPLSDAQEQAVTDYIERLRSSNHALESQGPRSAALRQRLGLAADTRILFVPLQRPHDTVVRYFSGAVDSLEELVGFVDRVAERLEELQPGRWKVLLKKHPLERERIRPGSDRVRYVPDETHVHDLLEAADAVLLLNSGVGLLSLCFGRPTFHVGDAFYGHPGLARAATDPHHTADAIVAGGAPDPAKVARFVHHLTTKVYSFADFETELKDVRGGDRQRITRHMEFRELRVLGEEFPVGGDRVLVVSPVIPSGIYRGSQSRVDMMIRALAASGRRISLAVLNTSFGGRTSRDIIRELRDTYPYLEYIEVRRHPKFDKTMVGRARWFGLKAADGAALAPHRIAGLETCPLSFRRCVAQMCDTFKPHFLLVNYAKLGPVVPDDFPGVSVIDTHDYQTQFLTEDQESNGIRRHVNRRLYRLSEHRELRRFDRLIAINPDEKETFRGIVATDQVHFVPAFAEASGTDPELFWARDHDALFVASMSNFNVKGLRWFAEQVLPLIRGERPEFVLQVVGNIARAKELRDVRWKGVRFHGIVPDLEPLYDQSHCVVAPILGGAGMKIKVVEALAHGKAIVATPKALDGIGAVDGEHLRVARDPRAFADAVLEVLRDADHRRRLEKGARALHARDHSPAAVATKLDQVFER